ncbi:hypothetical protein CDAR_213761 [Caerostris darwini]|uniref:Uncharacterized protein n=1 Tax=Caerostris darwini TaxID=1538125 RepID=A0AAV4X0N6_9ARAC|nr:hypothetical protein CDAR_213761 [Caerostris darwini]
MGLFAADGNQHSFAEVIHGGFGWDSFAAGSVLGREREARRRACGQMGRRQRYLPCLLREALILSEGGLPFDPLLDRPLSPKEGGEGKSYVSLQD